MAASIRSRIVLTLVSALIVAGLVASWATYHSTRSELSGLFDEQLRHTALELIERGDNDIKHTILVGQSPEMRFWCRSTMPPPTVFTCRVAPMRCL